VKLFEGVRVIRVFAASYLLDQVIHAKLYQPPGRLRHVVVCGSALPLIPRRCNIIIKSVFQVIVSNRPQRCIVNQVIERHDARNGSSASPGRSGHRAQIQGVRGGGNERCVEGDVHRHLDIGRLPTILEPGSLGSIFQQRFRERRKPALVGSHRAPRSDYLLFLKIESSFVRAIRAQIRYSTRIRKECVVNNSP
jgi:hypothetical protein